MQYLNYPSVPITQRENKSPRPPKSLPLEKRGPERCAHSQRCAGRALCLPLGIDPALNEVNRRLSVGFSSLWSRSFLTNPKLRTLRDKHSFVSGAIKPTSGAEELLPPPAQPPCRWPSWGGQASFLPSPGAGGCSLWRASRRASRQFCGRTGPE